MKKRHAVFAGILAAFLLVWLVYLTEGNAPVAPPYEEIPLP